jgi:hypothetical protein
LIQGIGGAHQGCVLRLHSVEDAPGGATVTLVVEELGDTRPTEIAVIKAKLEEIGQRLISVERKTVESEQRHAESTLRYLSHEGVPVAGVQKTTIRTFAANGEEENEGLHPHIRWAKTPDFSHVYRGILPMNRVFFLTSALCLVRPTQAGRVFQRDQ